MSKYLNPELDYSSIDIEDAIYKINLNRASKRMSKIANPNDSYRRIPVERIEDPRRLIDDQLKEQIILKQYDLSVKDEEEYEDYMSKGSEDSEESQYDFYRNKIIKKTPEKQQLSDIPIYKKTVDGLTPYDINKFNKNKESEKIYRPPSYYKNKTEVTNNKRDNLINALKNYSNSNNNNNDNQTNNQTNNQVNNQNDNLVIEDTIELNKPVVIEFNHNGCKYTFELDKIDNLELESLRYSNSKINKKIYEGKIELSGLVSVSKN